MKRKLSSAFDNYEFYSFVVFSIVLCEELSSTYLDAIKSRLYLKNLTAKRGEVHRQP